MRNKFCHPRHCTNRRLLIFLIFTILALFISACGSQKKSVTEDPIYSYLQPESGSIVINKQIKVSDTKAEEVLIGFTPVQFDSYWLEVNLENSEIKLMLGQNTIMNSKLQLSGNTTTTELNSKQHRVLFKDQNSIWYSDDNYYLTRNLEVPSPSAAERFLKGAYGEKTIFLDSGWSIFHNDLEGIEIENSLKVDKRFLEAVFEVISVDSLIKFS